MKEVFLFLISPRNGISQLLDFHPLALEFCSCPHYLKSLAMDLNGATFMTVILINITFIWVPGRTAMEICI